jgi:hypothetical protein
VTFDELRQRDHERRIASLQEIVLIQLVVILMVLAAFVGVAGLMLEAHDEAQQRRLKAPTNPEDDLTPRELTVRRSFNKALYQTVIADGDRAAALRNWRDAERHYRIAFELSRAVFGEGDIETSPSKISYARALIELGALKDADDQLTALDASLAQLFSSQERAHRFWLLDDIQHEQDKVKQLQSRIRAAETRSSGATH